MARILVIDDDALVRETVAAMLAAGGHETVLAGGSADGIRQFRGQRFDLVICDLFMPTKESGLEMIAALRAVSAATTPIILMTGGVPVVGGQLVGPEPLRSTEEDFGPLHVIGKPFRMHDLLAMVTECLASMAVWLGTSQAIWI